MKKITLLLLALIFVTACNNNLDDELILTPSEVSFTNGGIQFTKVTNSQFDNGDEILVKALTNNSVYKQTNYTHSNSKFTSTSPFEITEGQQFAYHAIYPSSASFYGTHQIFEDQSIAENYEQSDLLVAKVNETDASTPELKFNHVMSSIILNVKVLNNGAEVSDATLDVAFNLKTAADIDVNSERYTSLGSINTITPYPSVGNGSTETYNYSLIVAPQTVPANNVIANIIINDADKFQFSQSTDLVLQSSKQYTYTFTVDIATKKSSIEFNGSINNWEDVTSDGSQEYKSVLTLADFSEGYCPTSSDSWIITDETATTEDFEGLKTILSSISSSGRKISLSFPNLKEFPADAFAVYSKSKLIGNSALIYISAPKANMIGRYAFAACHDLTGISLPQATIIEDRAFYECKALTTVSLPKIELAMLDWQWFVSSNKVSEIILKNITYCAEGGAFYNKNKSILYKYVEEDGITEFTAPESVTEVYNHAFCGCTNMTKISLPQVTTIGIAAFAGCYTLNSITLPQATSIGYEAFLFCRTLTAISVPEIETANWDWDCITLANKISEVKLKDKTYYAENGVFYNENKSSIYKYEETYGVTEFNAPESVTEILYKAFYRCYDLTSVSFSQATTIEDLAFCSCSSLTTASLPQASIIGSLAFYGCSALKSISLKSAAIIESYAFGYCTALTNLEIATECKLVSIDNSAFDNVTTENIDLVIGSENEGIDINNKTWNGYIFKSITLK